METTYSPGDQVRFKLAKKELDATVLESSDSSVELVKLESGYNIGIPKENILSSRILAKYEKGKLKIQEVVQNKKLKNIGMIITGGTIASKLDPRTGGVKHLADSAELSKYYPELYEQVNVTKVSTPFMIASESMSSEHWVMIAEETEKMLNDPEITGVIITHGTDTLGYTAAALSFYLRNLNKPVVLTYSQRSIDRASSDANLNLQCAATMAISDCAEVMIVGHATINDDYCHAHLGTKVRKNHTSRRDAFQSINHEVLAKITPGRAEFNLEYTKRDDKKKVNLDTLKSDKVALVKYYPGQDPAILDYYALKYKGIVVEATGLGHLPVSESNQNWLPKLKKHIKEGLVVCAAAQTQNGRLQPNVYSNGRELQSAGVIFLSDMLPETAFVKLGWVLGHHGWKKRVKEEMLDSIAGEISTKLSQ